MTQHDNTPSPEVRLRCQAALTSELVREEIADIAATASGWQQYERREGEGFRESVGRLSANDARAGRYGQVRGQLASLTRDACHAHYTENDLQAGTVLHVTGRLEDGLNIDETIPLPALGDQEMCAMQELGMLPQHIRFNQQRVDQACGVER